MGAYGIIPIIIQEFFMTHSHTIETISQTKSRVTVSVDAVTVAETHKSVVAKISKTANIKGFRPGKAPVRLIEQAMGEQIYKDTVNSLIDNSYNKVMSEITLKPAITPNIVEVKPSDKDGMAYVIEMEYYPIMTIENYTGMAVALPTNLNIDIEKEKEKIIRSMQKAWAPKNKTHVVTETSIVELEISLESDDKWLPIDTYEMFAAKYTEDSLSTKMLGLESGAVFSIDDTMPGAPETSKKNLYFKIGSIQEIAELSIEELCTASKKDMTVEAFTEFINQEAKNNILEKQAEAAYESIYTILCEGNEFDLPEGVLKQTKENLAKQPESKHTPEDDIIQSLKMVFYCEKIATQENLQPKPETVFKHYTKMGGSQTALNENIWRQASIDALLTTVLSFIMDKATITFSE
jgi:trigger factor